MWCGLSVFEPGGAGCGINWAGRLRGFGRVAHPFLSCGVVGDRPQYCRVLVAYRWMALKNCTLA